MEFDELELLSNVLTTFSNNAARIADALEKQNEIMSGRPDLSPIVENLIPAIEIFGDYIKREYKTPADRMPYLIGSTVDTEPLVFCVDCFRVQIKRDTEKGPVCLKCGSAEVLPVMTTNEIPRGADVEEKK